MTWRLDGPGLNYLVRILYILYIFIFVLICTSHVLNQLNLQHTKHTSWRLGVLTPKLVSVFQYTYWEPLSCIFMFGKEFRLVVKSPGLPLLKHRNWIRQQRSLWPENVRHNAFSKCTVASLLPSLLLLLLLLIIISISSFRCWLTVCTD